MNLEAVTVWETVSDVYTQYLSSADSKVTSWLLMKSPTPTFLIIGIYLYFIKVFGPAWMRDRKPFDLRATMFLYNFGIVALYVYFIGEFLITFSKTEVFRCRTTDLNDPIELRLAEMGWWFYFFKLVELADTVFFVLRKKCRQISTLHIIHHSLVPITVWFGFRVEPAGYNFFFPLINTLVHIVMYSYYGLAALGPNIQKYLWWKKYLTLLQMGQFMLVFMYIAVLTLVNCRVSKFIVFLNVFLAGLFLLLFLNFYRITYLKSKAFKASRSQVNGHIAKENCSVSSEKVTAAENLSSRRRNKMSDE